MKFDVIIPSLLVSPAWFADANPPRLPALESLLLRGGVTHGNAWPQCALDCFGCSAGVAALSALGDGIEVGNHGWMFAEPAHFQADRDTVNLLPRARLAISDAEALSLIAALNTNFADRGLVFVRGDSGQWYVQCETSELPETTPIHIARGGNLFDKLPRSRGKLSWKAIQNEAQMLLFADPVNAAREGVGTLTINGLWFWGEPLVPAEVESQPKVLEMSYDGLDSGLRRNDGLLEALGDARRRVTVVPAEAGTQSVVTHFESDVLNTGLRRDDDSIAKIKPNPSIGAVFGDISLAKGLAAWSLLPFSPMHELAIHQPPAAHSVVITDSLSAHLDRGDLAAWREALAAMEANLFVPLLRALREATIDELVLTLPRDHDALVSTIHAASFRGARGWWNNLRKPPRPFLEYPLA